MTVIVPTYKERENLPELLRRIGEVRQKHGLELDVLVLDDHSRDGTEEYFQSQAPPWATLITRRQNRGLSAAVLDGIRAATGETLVVMDADLSHPPETVPELLEALDKGAELAIGSRFVPGGGTTADWHLFRRINSRAATLLARPFTTVLDPMAGFFGLRRQTFERAAPLDPVGYKIGLELLVKCNVRRVTEVPILFTERRLGKSKLTPAEQWRYVEHLRRLAVYRFGRRAVLAFFGTSVLIGGGVCVVSLWALLRAGATSNAALIASACAMGTVVWAISRWWTCKHALQPGWSARDIALLGAGLLATAGQAFSAVWALHWLEHQQSGALTPYLAALLGIVVGGALGFALNAHLVRPAPSGRNNGPGGGA